MAAVRLNWNTVYCFKFAYTRAKSVYSYDPLAALREGMDIALVSLTLQTGDEERDANERRGILEIDQYVPCPGVVR